MDKDTCVDPGFVVAGARGKPIEAWSLYDVDLLDGDDGEADLIIGDEDILVSWDIENESEAGKIAPPQYDMLVEKLKQVMKGKQKK